MVHFESTVVTHELVSGLLATRAKRDLRSVHFDMIEQAAVAALVGELVGTDPDNEWTCAVALLSVAAASAFCRAVVSASSTRTSSLTSLSATLYTGIEGHKAFADLFAAHSGLRHFDVVRNEVIQPSSNLTMLWLTLVFLRSTRETGTSWMKKL